MSATDCSSSKGNCIVCGDPIPLTAHGRQFCSYRCRDRYRSRPEYSPRKHEPRPPSVCEWCGAEFKTRSNGASMTRSGKQQRTNRFCCLEHANKAAAFARTKHGACSPLRFAGCAVCGSAFVKRGNSVTCSDECKRARAMSCNPNYKGPTTQACRYCGSEFWSDRQGARWYCCVEHRDADKKRRHKQRMKTDKEYAAAYRAAKHARRMREAGVPGSHTTAEWRARLAEYKGKCAHCRTRKATTKDHVIPKSRGGTDDISNILPSCRRCNCEMKRDLMPNDEWFAERRGQLALVVW